MERKLQPIFRQNGAKNQLPTLLWGPPTRRTMNPNDKKMAKNKKVRYHKIKKFFVFWKVGSLLIMYPDMFFHDLFILDPKNRVKVKSICPKFKLLRILLSKLISHPIQMWL